MMPINAVYENGVFRPTEPVDLPEQTRVTVALIDPTSETTGLVADAYFSAADRMRLADLMARWRQARDTGSTFTNADRTELDSLVASELQASVTRSAAALRTHRP